MAFLKKIGDSFLEFFYPWRCLYCESQEGSGKHVLCSSCSELLTFIDPLDRCPYCFSSDYDIQEKVCRECYHRSLPFDGVAAAYEYLGPAGTLVKRLKYGRMAFLSEGMAAALTAQMVALQWPEPMVLVPVPIPWQRKLSRGFNQSKLLADKVGGMLNIPVIQALGRRHGGLPQAGLDSAQRKKLSKESFILKKSNKITGKNVVLIDDVYTTGTTLLCCAETLLTAKPAKIFAITFCRAL